MDSFKALLTGLLKCIITLLLITSMGGALNAQNLRLNKSVSESTPAPGQPFNFILDIACQSTTSPCEDVYISGYWKIGLIEDQHQIEKRKEQV
mgnify:CR=1 FL=1